MRKNLFQITLILLIVLSFDVSAQIRVATVGNSITFGAGVDNRTENNYPAQLQRKLGVAYKVVNFGVSGTTLLYNGNSPYVATSQYQASLEFNPDIVLIKLGTNDAKSFNRDKIKEHYMTDYQKLIDSYNALPSKPRVILLTPVACYLAEGVFAGANNVYQREIIPAICQLAYKNDIEVVDLFHVFGLSVPDYIMPDKLHPSGVGMTHIVERLAPVVLNDSHAPTLVAKVAPSDAKQFNFYGYKGYMWAGGYKIVEPRHSSRGNQWVIRARFWGHEPQIDIALLERGFHVAYCPVEDMYGSPEAVARWDEFYRTMVEAGFAPKVVLEGMSRGGLIVYNWAARNADKVAAIYADAPVMDLKSWPMRSSPDDTKKMLAAYCFQNENEARAWQGNPIDHAATLTKIPIIHVVGQADQVVPVVDNTDVFKDRLQKAGGFMTVIRKDGVGHHPHSLRAPQTIVDFILVATNQVENHCTVPQAGHEWRSGAGWVEGADWGAVAREISDSLSRPCDVLLLGNSITQTFGGTRRLITSFAGRDYLNRALGDSIRWVSAGISGDRTQNLLWRLRNGNYHLSTPKSVFIMIGVNNMVNGDSAAQTAEGVLAVCREASVQFPKAKITVFGSLPYFDMTKSKALHDCLSSFEFPANVKYVNPWNWFVDGNGAQILEYYGRDRLHLSAKGYEMWSKKIAQIYYENQK